MTFLLVACVVLATTALITIITVVGWLLFCLLTGEKTK